MIKYSLICEFLHSFEAWFSSSASFEKQCDLNLVTCPECGNSKIRRALMTPNLSAGYNKKKHNKVEGSHSDATTSEEGIMHGQDHPKTSQITKRSDLSSNNQINSMQVITMLRNIRNYFENNGRNVGNKFAEEALKIHYGEKEPDLIYGTCTPEEGEQLTDEGVEFAELPSIPKDN